MVRGRAPRSRSSLLPTPMPLAMPLLLLLLLATAPGGGASQPRVDSPGIETNSAIQGQLEEEGLNLGLLNEHRRQLQQNTKAFIANGVPAQCGRYPYMASLRTNQNKHNCGGMLIHQSFVLTAAHCVDPNSADTLGPQPIVVVGGCNLDDKPGDENPGGKVEMFRAVNAIFHPSWNGSVENGYDIALLILDNVASNAPVAMADDSVAVTGKVVVLGWGLQEGDVLPRDLHEATEISVLPNMFCNTDSDGWPELEILESQVCAFGQGSNQDTCPGDSGGPMLLANNPGSRNGDPDKDLLVGITSFGELGKACGMSTRPAVYTRVSSFVDWITETIKERNLTITITPVPDDDDGEVEPPAPAPAPDSDVCRDCSVLVLGRCLYCNDNDDDSDR